MQDRLEADARMEGPQSSRVERRVTRVTDREILVLFEAVGHLAVCGVGRRLEIVP